jgi:flagellar biosynthetic protein FliO
LTLRALASFGVVIALLIGFVWLLRRGSLAFPGSRPRAVIAIETAASLGERRSLVIVSVEGKRLLLGVAAGGVSLLSELTAAAAADSPAAGGGPR